MARHSLITAALEILGEAPADMRPLHGGDLSDVTWLAFGSGRSAVAKQGPLVDREARMLQAIAATGAPAPAVLGQHADILLLEALNETTPGPRSWNALGAGLRRLHGTTGAQYGWSEDYAFGSVEISNRPVAGWPSFWAERRLLASSKNIPAPLMRRLERLCSRLENLLPAAPPAALLHGDIWVGNALFGPDGSAHLIDPACYFGDAEVDLAMLHLFAKPPEAFARAYGPLEPGWDVRRAVYQLWPALVHLRLFGSGYLGMVEQRLLALGS